MRNAFVWNGLLAAACGTVTDPPDLLETGWFDDGPPALCAAKVGSTLPEDGASDWYWRAPLVAYLDEADDEAYVFRVTDDGGREIPVEVTKDDTGLVATITPVDGLPSDTSLRLQIEDCLGPREIAFSTSSLGAPLEGGVGALVGRTWRLEVEDATWVEPAGLATLLPALPFSPILVGVAYADAEWVDWIGAQGRVTTDGIDQSPTVATWNFPLTPFEDAPYFDSFVEDVELAVQTATLPITDLRLTGTFAADGSEIGGATLSGLGDTRDLGKVLGSPGDPDALCELAEDFDVVCVDCPDGKPYCLDVQIEDLHGTELRGLTLVPIDD